MNNPYSVSAFGNPWARISAIAARVGVGPAKDGVASVCAVGADGKTYDIFEVVSAVLDKIDEAVK